MAPERFVRTGFLSPKTKTIIKNKSIVRTLVNQWGWPLILRCLSHFFESLDSLELDKESSKNFLYEKVRTFVPLYLLLFIPAPQLEIFLGYLLIPLPNALTLSLIRDI